MPISGMRRVLVKEQTEAQLFYVYLIASIETSQKLKKKKEEI